MSLLMRKTICRQLKGRFYSAQVATKKQENISEVTSTKVNGITVVTADNAAPLSRVMFVAKAGSRHERDFKGLTHVIRHIAHMGNPDTTSFKLFKSVEAFGSSFNAATTREYAITSFSCTRNYLSQVFELVASSAVRRGLTPIEWKDSKGCVDQITLDVAGYYAKPNIMAMEELHAAAYRDSLGNSLYCQKEMIGSHNIQMIGNFINAHYTPDRMAVVATGAAHDEVMELAGNIQFTGYDTKPNDVAANYKGGERRVYMNNPTTHAALAVEGPSLASKDLLCTAVLQQCLGLDDSMKYSDSVQGSKLLAAVSKVAEKPYQVQAINVNYTDSGLFGLGIQADPTEIDTVLETAAKEFRNIMTKGVTDAEVAIGKYNVKAFITMEMEKRDTILMSLAEQALGSDRFTTLKEVLAMVDSIQTSDVNNVAKKLGSGKPSMASVGLVNRVPYLDQLFP